MIIGIAIPTCAKHFNVTIPKGIVTFYSDCFNVDLSQTEYVDDIFEETTAKDVPIRRLGISFSGLADESAEGYDLFTDFEAIEKERRLEQAVLDIKDRFGKNAMLRAFDLQEGATQVERNKLIGGHNGGE